MSDNKLVTLANARIQMLFEAGRAAIGIKDLDTYDSAVSQLNASCQDLTIPTETRELAATYHDKLGLEAMDAGLVQLEEIVTRLNDAMNGLDKAVKIATAGKEGLTVPAMAKAAEQTLSSVDKLRQAWEALKANNLSDAAASLKELVAGLKLPKPKGKKRLDT